MTVRPIQSTPTIRFIRRGEVVSLINVAPSRTLLQVLREDLRCTGTKEGCAEGDCGACTVVTGEAEDGRIRWRAVNSCIKLAHSVDGLALWTVEDLASSDGTLHPAQQAMLQCHGSQCGFCTPGFVMSLYGMYQNHVREGRAITRELAQEELSGNLCRCTGYQPILQAAQAMAALPKVAIDETDLLQKLKLLAPAPVGLQPDFSYKMPQNLSQLLATRAAHPEAQLVAGCTDVGLWVTKQLREFDQIIDLTRVAELRCIEDYPQHLAIGAAVTLADAYAALVKDRPQLHAFAARFAGLPVRNAGTLGGNVANGSPIGDSMPLLIALRASLVLMSVRGHRELAVEDFYTGYRKTALAAGEVLAWVKVPKAGNPHPSLPPGGEGANPGAISSTPSPSGGGPGWRLPALAPSPLRGEGGGEGLPASLQIYKITKRFDDDISAVCLAIDLHIEHGQVVRASIGAGGVAATPVRARQTEAALTGQPWTQATVQRAIATLRAEFTPLSDMRASTSYRREVLGNLLQRYWLETQGMQQINLQSFTLQEPA